MASLITQPFMLLKVFRSSYQQIRIVIEHPDAPVAEVTQQGTHLSIGVIVINYKTISIYSQCSPIT
jgi:hypothetical protein